MPTDDVVAELDRWLADNATAITITSWAMIKRARDEIVGLRAVLDIQKRLPDKIAVVVHDAALEHAAAACLRKARDHVIPIGQDNFHDGCISCAAAIRELKGKGDE